MGNNPVVIMEPDGTVAKGYCLGTTATTIYGHTIQAVYAAQASSGAGYLTITPSVNGTLYNYLGVSQAHITAGSPYSPLSGAAAGAYLFYFIPD